MAGGMAPVGLARAPLSDIGCQEVRGRRGVSCGESEDGVWKSKPDGWARVKKVVASLLGVEARPPSGGRVLKGRRSKQAVLVGMGVALPLWR